MGMSTGNGGRKKAMSEINVTPLVDVMLVLLIIFMVAAPMITNDEKNEVEMNLPVTRNNPNTVNLQNTDKFILRIDESLRVWVEDEVIVDCSAAASEATASAFEPCFDEVEEKLGNNYVLAEDQALYLMADTSIPYGFVVGTMNRLRKAGVTNIGMITNPEYIQ
jgi:biopolymer transport protein TolR